MNPDSIDVLLALAELEFNLALAAGLDEERANRHMAEHDRLLAAADRLQDEERR